MEQLSELRRPPGDLEARLRCRRAIEDVHHKGRRAHGRGDFLLRHDRIVGPILRTLLQAVFLYRRGQRNAIDPVLVHRILEFAALPPELEGFRLMHLSDFHIDGVDGLAEVLAERLLSLPVDLCVMTGDYRFEIEGPCAEVYARLGKVLPAIRSRLGVAAILGNHDAAEIAPALEEMGVRMLINEAEPIPGANAWVIGVEDPHYYGCDDLPAALRTVPSDAFRILLAHSPELFQEAADSGIHLYLCGHTHAGQIRLPWIGSPLRNADCPRQYTHGLWRHESMLGYTSAGLGASMLPVRYGCPPEIVVLELHKAPPSDSICLA